MGTQCAPQSMGLPSQETIPQEMEVDFSKEVDYREDPESAKLDSGSCPEATVNPSTQTTGESGGCSEVKVKRSSRRKADIYYGIFDLSSDEDLDSEKPSKVCYVSTMPLFFSPLHIYTLHNLILPTVTFIDTYSPITMWLHIYHCSLNFHVSLEISVS